MSQLWDSIVNKVTAIGLILGVASTIVGFISGLTIANYKVKEITILTHENCTKIVDLEKKAIEHNVRIKRLEEMPMDIKEIKEDIKQLLMNSGGKK